MNELFVNVKVDREERPDVDAIYMQAVQALTGRGGWPMSVWCTPDGRPFYGGTYYPNEERHGMPSFARVCEAVARSVERTARRGARAGGPAHRGDRRDSDAARDAASSSSPAAARATRTTTSRAQFEPQYGGFGRAPKFPQAMTLDFLCRSYCATSPSDTLEMITTTLDAMAAGGMYDQLGGGFARYSTDDYWLVPHFEKMLYDNALLDARVPARLPRSPASRAYRRIVEETIGYVLRDLRHPEGGFFSAEDADSEGDRGQVLPAGRSTRSARSAATTPTR